MTNSIAVVSGIGVPDAGRALGRGMREFKDGASGRSGLDRESESDG